VAAQVLNGAYDRSSAIMSARWTFLKLVSRPLGAQDQQARIHSNHLSRVRTGRIGDCVANFVSVVQTTCSNRIMKSSREDRR
jgi:hypothetical protein